MSRYMFGTSLVAVFVFAAVLWLGSSSQPVSAQAQPKAQQWEYKFLKQEGMLKDIANELNKAGKDGWEFAAVYGEEFLLKRPKR